MSFTLLLKIFFDKLDNSFSEINQLKNKVSKFNTYYY